MAVVLGGLLCPGSCLSRCALGEMSGQRLSVLLGRDDEAARAEVSESTRYEVDRDDEAVFEAR